MFDKHGRRADKGHHRSQAFEKSFNKVLGQRLFRAMYQRGFDDGKPSNAWVAALPEVELVETGANLGFAGGNNVGYAHARDRLGAAFIAVINNDTRIEQADFILRCERLFRETACSVLGPDIVTPDGRRENPWNDSVYGPGEWRRLEGMYHEDRADFERTGQPRFRRLGRRSPEAAFVPNPVLQGAALVLSPVFVRGMPTLFDERTKLYGEEFLFAVDTLTARPIGVAVYIRADLEHVTVLHLGLSEDYCAGGMNEGSSLLLRLLGEVRRSSRRMRGVRRLQLLYGAQRLRASAL